MADESPLPPPPAPSPGGVAGPLRILQITDTHLFADPRGTLLGVQTLDSLKRVAALAREHRPRPHCLLATGDLVHDGSEAGYCALREVLQRLGPPAYCLPGNHDQSANMRRCLAGDGIRVPGRVDCGDWTLVLLDSNRPGSDTGHLRWEELERLERTLLETADRHVMLCLHHPPVAVGSAWMDTMKVDNAGEFFRIVDHHSQVRVVLFGHIHQPFEAERRGVRLIGSPSTCVQFEPGRDDFTIAAQPPGYRWLELFPDGHLNTGIRRVDDYASGIEMDSPGY